KAYGDGWSKPFPVNTYRLASFARVLDAACGEHQLIQFIDHSTAEWFKSDYDIFNGDKKSGLASEYVFYKDCGISLEAVEEQICIQPGQLLIIDNMRAVHGRVGSRHPREIVQFLYGAKSVSPSQIDVFRRYLAGLFAQKNDFAN